MLNAFTVDLEDWYQGLSDEDRAKVDAAAETANKANRDWLASQESVYGKLKEAGVQISELGDDARAAFRGASQPVYQSGLVTPDQLAAWKTAKGE